MNCESGPLRAMTVCTSGLSPTSCRPSGKVAGITAPSVDDSTVSQSATYLSGAQLARGNKEVGELGK